MRMTISAATTISAQVKTSIQKIGVSMPVMICPHWGAAERGGPRSPYYSSAREYPPRKGEAPLARTTIGTSTRFADAAVGTAVREPMRDADQHRQQHRLHHAEGRGDVDILVVIIEQQHRHHNGLAAVEEE